jgi:lipopolysaccharide/colanic/teichoic acid biosynthesis glycosyltransferase
VKYALFVVSPALITLVAYALRRPPGTGRSGPPCRAAFLVSVGLTVPVWGSLYLAHQASAPAVLLMVGGAFAGAVVLTAATTGIVEDNAPPSADTREKVLAHHVLGDLRYPAQPPLKRTFDIAGALIGLAVTLPLWAVIAFLIWFEEPGPIFFTKNSVGRGGITFRQLKFRSMTCGAEHLTGPVASTTDDARMLRVGRRLRRWHLDELPELINVLVGTMSLVGPRPLRTVLVQVHLEEVPGYAERHTVRPGIACTAQIEKYHISPAERLDKDLAYIHRQSLWLDLKLLGRAVLTTIRSERQRYEPADGWFGGAAAAGNPADAPVRAPRALQRSTVPGWTIRQRAWTHGRPAGATHRPARRGTGTDLLPHAGRGTVDDQ